MITNFLRLAASVLRRYYVDVRRLVGIRDRDWRDACRTYGVPTGCVKLLPDSSLEVCVGRTCIQFPKAPRSVGLLRGYELLRQLDSRIDCEMSWDSALGALTIRFARALYTVEQYEELYILSELYLSGDYSLLVPNPCLMLDVGANVGFSAIFLAAQNPALKLLAFEPLPRNFRRAERNIAQNISLQPRITLFNHGLYSSDQDVEIQCDEENPGMSSVVLDRRVAGDGRLSSSTVKMKTASDVVRDTSKHYEDSHLWMKMDCEGSEYAILDNLIATGTISLIEVFVLEWHALPTGEGLNEIENRLLPQGFGLYARARNLLNQPAGIVVAFRRTVGEQLKAGATFGE